MELSAEDRRLLAAIEDGLPLAPAPYAVVAKHLGMDEADVLDRLSALQAAGVIQRMGVVVRHRALGYRANAMAVWDVPDDAVDEAGQRLAALPYVTLSYRRPRRPPAWPYNLFAMIHGRDRDTVEREVAAAGEAAGIAGRPGATLFSRRCFKQRGARYRGTR